MSTVVRTETTTQTQNIFLRLSERAEDLLAILEAHVEWTDPTSEKIRDWTLHAFDGIESAPEEKLTQHLRERIDELDLKILTNSLTNERLTEVPYLIDGENVLPEKMFDELYHVAHQAKQPGSPWNQKPMLFRQKMHAFALAVLRWRGITCHKSAPTQAVPLLDPLEASCQYLLYQTLASDTLELKKLQKIEQLHLQNAAKIRAQTEELKTKHRHLASQGLDACHASLKALETKLSALDALHREKLRESQEKIQELEETIEKLKSGVGAAEQMNEQQKVQIAQLQQRIRAIEAEMARMRAELDDDGCAIL